eukprot:1159820-Pelagomonas_calceolata.AAC.11
MINCCEDVVHLILPEDAVAPWKARAAVPASDLVESNKLQPTVLDVSEPVSAVALVLRLWMVKDGSDLECEG